MGGLKADAWANIKFCCFSANCRVNAAGGEFWGCSGRVSYLVSVLYHVSLISFNFFLSFNF